MKIFRKIVNKIIKENYSVKSIIIIILSCMVISIGVGFLFELCSNYRGIKYGSKDITTNWVSEFETEGMTPGNGGMVTGENGGKIYLSSINGYVRNLQLNSFSTKSFNYTIKYKAKNINGEEQEYIIKSPTSFKLNMTSEFIDKFIHDVEVTIDEPNITLFHVQIDNNYHINYYRISLVAIVVLLVMLFVIFHKTKMFKLEYAFLLISLTMGTMIVMCVPNTTFYSYDDETHYNSTLTLFDKGLSDYTDSENQMTVALPFPFNTITSQAEKNTQDYYLNFNDNYAETKKGQGSLLKVPTLFLGNALQKSTKHFGVKFTTRFKLGKLLNVLIYSVVCFIAIKIVKRFKKLLFVICLLPTTIWLASNYSCDPVLTSGIFLTLALIINLYVEKNKKVKFIYTIPIFLVFMWADITKYLYFPLLFVGLFVPKEKFKTKKDRILFKSSICLTTLLLASIVFVPMLSSSAEVSGDSRGGSDVNGAKQISIILKHPVSYAKVLKDNAGKQFMFKLTDAHTLNSFGYAGDGSNNITMTIVLMLFFVSLTDNKERKKNDFPKSFKISILFCTIITMILVWTSMYVGFTPVGLEVINGVQNRYFIPFLFPILILLNTTKIKFTFDDNKYNLIISIICLVILSSMIYDLLLIPFCL